MPSSLRCVPALASCALILTAVACTTPKVWVEADDRMDLEVAQARRLVVETNNGHISCATAPTDGIAVKFLRRAGAATEDEARRVLDEIDVFAERAEDAIKIGWRWRSEKRPSWGAGVTFELSIPEHLSCSAVTHNGSVRLTGMRSDVHLESHNGSIEALDIRGSVDAKSHNGRIEIDSTGPSLRAVTHNGSVHATYAGPTVYIVTHNGGIRADLENCAEVGGHIETHNGSVTLIAGPNTSAELEANTDNGRVRATLDEVIQARKTHARGRLGQGGPQLDVSTHNGDVELRR